MKALQVTTTVGAEADARKLADLLLEAKAAACVQTLGPVQSQYHWKDKLERTKEWMLVIKTDDDHYDEVNRLIRENHPYDVPEVLAFPVVVGDADYLEWLGNQLS